MHDDEKSCRACKWYDAEWGECRLEASGRRAAFVELDDTCESWEEGDEVDRSSARPGGEKP